MKKTNKNIIMYLLLFLVSTLLIIFVYNNYFLYDRPILKITNIKSVYNDDEIIIQNITGIIKNGKYKNNILTVENETSLSGVYDEQIHNKSELFVSISNNGTYINEITGIKRDKYLVILLVVFINLIIFVGKMKGIKTLFSLAINITLSVLAIYLYANKIIGIQILPLFIILSILFIVLSLLICHGYNKKTLSAIISSTITLLISFIISFIILSIYSESIYYWYIEYIDIVSDYKGIFYTNILLCGLGAIMDISITMSSSLNELVEKNKRISFKSLKKSGKEISKDILGTMINVMLFTCYMSVIPIAILAIKNNMLISDVLNTYGQIEMIRILTSCISIVTAIPISLYVSLWIFKKVNKND